MEREHYLRKIMYGEYLTGEEYTKDICENCLHDVDRECIQCQNCLEYSEFEKKYNDVIEKAKEGYVRVDTMELSMAVQTNYWVMTMVRPVESEPEAPQEPKKTAGRPAKTKD